MVPYEFVADPISVIHRRGNNEYRTLSLARTGLLTSKDEIRTGSVVSEIFSLISVLCIKPHHQHFTTILLLGNRMN